MFSKLKVLALAGLVSMCSPLEAEEHSADEKSISEQPSEQREANLGLNIFGLSLHTNWSKEYNEVNPGVGLRYVFSRPAPRGALFGDIGTYYDSSYNWAKYVAAGTYYSLSPSWKVGAATAYGQSKSYYQGKPFFAPIPGLAFQYRRIVLNMIVLPSDDAAAMIAGFAFYLTVALGHGK